MSYADYRIGQLWGSFMPRRKEIINNVDNDLISLVVYKPAHFADFKLTNEFERWATVEVTSFDNIPNEMETYTLPSGLYAVFLYKGTTTDISSFFQNIFNVWIPNSDYVLDNRPHFEVLGEKYKNNDPSSEEEIWIPIKMK
jgi:AraC family transcriptional regulator